MGDLQLSVRVSNKLHEAQGVCSFELEHPLGASLPEYTPGAHIDIEIEPGLVRQYSLYGDPDDRHRYRIAVKCSPISRGGSTALHEKVRCGDTLRISEPRNLFPLSSERGSVLFLAAGIGITPIFCMANSLARNGGEFAIHYCAKSATDAAFYRELQGPSFEGRVNFHFSHGDPLRRLSMRALERDMRFYEGVYVCGPASFIHDAREAAQRAGYALDRVRSESFDTEALVAEDNSAFEVQLAKSGMTFVIPAGKTVAEVLMENGISLPLSCGQGLCGSCLTPVLEGEIDHRDRYLSEEERSMGDIFTPCRSRALGSRLVLDL